MNAQRWRAPLLALLVGALPVAILPVAGQTPDKHAAHHSAPSASEAPIASPEATEPAGPGSTPEGGKGAMGSGMGGMESMMKMASPPPEPLYPFLMRFPDLTAEARVEVRERADRDARAGLAALSLTTEAARSAAQAGDLEAAARAAVAVREAQAQVESAQAALRALQEGRPPREAALAWFRREMSLTGPGLDLAGGYRRASPWRHRVGIGVLAAVATGFAVSFAVRVRRASNLLARLTERDEAVDADQ